MAAPLSECAKSFLRFATGRVRQQLKAALQTYKQLLQIQLTALVAKIGRGDFIAARFQNGINALNTLIGPIEKQIAQLPLAEFRTCQDLSFTLGNFENNYFKLKSELLEKTYKFAQFGFASAHANNLRDNLENQLDKVDQMIAYLDSVAHLDLLEDQEVYVYTQETDANGIEYPITREGTIVSSVPGVTVDILMDDTGAVESFAATDIQTKA